MSDQDENDDATTTVAKDPAATVPSGKILTGTDQLFDGNTHLGLTIEVAASGKVSHLVISDALKVKNGAPVFITAPVRLKGANLKKFLTVKGVSLEPALDNFLKNVEISCEAFYFSTNQRTLSAAEATEYIAVHKLTANTTPKSTDVTEGYSLDEGPLLMMFEIQVKGGLIKALTQDEALGELFDVSSAQLRVLRCTASNKDILVKYAESLSEQ